MTMCSADEDMRKRHVSIFHHIYYKQTEYNKEGKYLSFGAFSSKNRENMSADGPVTKALVKTRSCLWTNPLSLKGMTDITPVAYYFVTLSYYVLLRNLKTHRVTLIKDGVISQYDFMHPELQQKKWAQFPTGILTPTNARR